MSWWISLNDPKTGKAVKVATHREGGTINSLGEDRAIINVTYNYSELIYEAIGCSITDFHEKSGEQVIDSLKAGITFLGKSKKDPDYWKPTKGNVSHLFHILLRWALDNPKAIFCIN